MVMIMVKFCAVSPSKNENRGLPLRKTGDCPDPDRSFCRNDGIKNRLGMLGSARFSSFAGEYPLPKATTELRISARLDCLAGGDALLDCRTW